MTLTASSPGGSTRASDPASWVDVCGLDDLDPERGSAVLIDDRQVAVFWLPEPVPGDPAGGELFAVGNRDPFCGANVMARGVVGSAGDVVYVASPMHKQRFDLRTGVCLDDEAVAIPVWPARLSGTRVELQIGGR